MDAWIFWGFVLFWFRFLFACKYTAKMKRKKSTVLKNNALCCAFLCACMYACASTCMYVSVHVLAYMCILKERLIPNPTSGTALDPHARHFILQTKSSQ